MLLVIADAIDKGRGVSCASIGYLAKRARMGRRKIFRVLKRLRDGGELRVSGTGGGGHENTNRYSLNPLPLNSAVHDTNTGVSADTGTGVTGDTGTGDKSCTDGCQIVPLTGAHGGHTIPSESLKNPLRAITDVPAHAQRVGKPSKLNGGKGTKTEWPEHLLLTPEMREFAAKFGINPDTEFVAWHDDCRAHGRRYIDWTAAWRTRCRNAVKFAPGSAGRATPPLTARQMAEQSAARDRGAM